MNGLLILTEAGKDIGFGHLTRCSAILEDFISRGIKTRMLVYHAGPSSGYGMNTREFNWHIENLPEEELRGMDFLLVDSYLATPERLEQLSKLFRYTAALDDFNRVVYPFDLVINPNVYFRKENYLNQHAKVIGGRSFTILRQAFRNQISRSVHIRAGQARVLVTLGGSDVHLLSITISGVLLNAGYQVRVIAPEEHVRAQILKEHPEAIVLASLDQWQMLDEYLYADLVVSACGQTLHELAATGCTTIGIVVGHDQEGNQRFYLESGYLWFDFSWRKPDWLEKLSEAAQILIQPEIRNYIGSLSPFLPDRNGVRNYFEVMQKLP